MPQNIEVKARVSDVRLLLKNIAALGAKGPEILVQTDTFYNCPHGRMKLRECQGKSSEMVVYLRPDVKGAKTCDYARFPVSDPAHAKTILKASHGVLGVLEKKRQLYLIENTRIHVDEVKGLGNFMELEVVLKNQTQAEGVEIAEKLMAQLGISKEDLISNAYIDMLQATAKV
jgi:predicted adenylyl cyclase CyaB